MNGSGSRKFSVHFIAVVITLFTIFSVFTLSYGATPNTTAMPTILQENPFGHTSSLFQQKDLAVTSNSNIMVQNAIDSDAIPTTGTAGNDIMIGDSGNNLLYGGNGNDAIQGHEGDDTIYGGNGNDNLQGGTGPDVLYGQEGKDFLAGGFEDDYLNGGPGDDVMYGNPGDDVLEGGPGADNFNCGDGIDYVVDFNPAEGDTTSTDCEHIDKVAEPSQ